MALEVLIREYQRRSLKNPRYSVRSFAKSLGVSHSLLSMVLNGKRNPSRKLEALIEQKFREPSTPSSRDEYSEIKADQFEKIASWLHYAILSSTTTSKSFTPKSLAKRFGVTETQVKIAIQDLIRTQLLAKTKSGKWIQKSRPIHLNNFVQSSFSSALIRMYLDKANESMDQGDVLKRDLRVNTFAMNAKDIQFASEKITTFRRQLVQELESRGAPDTVMAFCTNLFSLEKL